MFKHKYNNLRIYFESSTVISWLLWRLTNINTECTDFAALCSSSSADKFYTHANFLFQQDLTPADSATQTAKATTKCLLTMLLLWLTDRPNHPTRNLGNIAKRKTTNTRRKKKVKAAIKAPWGLLTPHHGLPPCHTPLMQWFMLKERRVKKRTYFSGVGHLFYDPLHNIYCHIYKNFTL